MLLFVRKIMILILLHIICNVTAILTGAIEATDPFDYFGSEMAYSICFFANIIFYQVYVYVNYKIGDLNKIAYKIVYWTLNFIFLLATLCLWLPGLVA